MHCRSKISVALLCFLALCMAITHALGQGIITTVAGSTWIFRGDGGPAISAPLGNIAGVATDAAGNVYIVDSGNDIVASVSPSGILTVVAGNGIRGFSGDGGSAPSASLFSPGAVAIDAAGNVFIADTLNHRVRKVTRGVITTLAGTGAAGFSGDGGPAGAARLNAPAGVAVDAAGSVYIADTLNHRIRSVRPDGTITTVAGAIRGFSGDGGAATSASLNSPRGLALDAAGNLYLADRDNHRIRRISISGTIATVAGSGLQGFSGDGGSALAASLNFPYAVAVDSAGRLLLADSVNQRIRRVADGVISTVAGSGPRGFSGDGGLATQARLNQPQGIAAAADGSLYIGDTINSRVRRVAPAGTIATVAGNGSYKFAGDGGPALAAALNGPQGIAADGAGNLYFADAFSHRVRRRNAAGIISTVAGTGLAGYSGDGGPAASAALNSPSAVAVDAAGNLYVADSGNHCVRRISAAGAISTLAGSGSAGFSGDGGPATVAALNQPAGVAADAAGNVYISDAANNRIRRVNAAGVIATVAGSGAAGYSGDGGSALAAALNSPAGLAVNDAGSIFVADTANHRVRRFTVGGNIVTVAGSGVPGSAGDGGVATAALLNTPAAVAVDRSGALFIAEIFGNRLRRVAGGVINTVAGIGLAGFAGDGGPAGLALLNQPLGIAVDSAGALFIADSLNDRIRAVLPSAPSFTAAPEALSFRVPAGTPATGSQVVEISSAVAGLSWSASAVMQSGGQWLVLSSSSGVMPGSITVSANPALLAPGTYRGTITIVSFFALPSLRTVSVELVVEAASSPALLVEPSALTVELPAGAATAARSVRIANAGAGTLEWSASVVNPEGTRWLSVSPPAGTASSSAPATLQLLINAQGLAPGVYSGAVQVRRSDGAQRVTLAITLLLAQPVQTILLSQTGLLFTGVEGGESVPAQEFGILNIGEGSMAWTVTANTISGGGPSGGWLAVTPASGRSGAEGEIPLVSAGASIGTLRQGRYSGLLEVRAPAANNSPQHVTVDLNVLPAGANPGVLVRPTGLIFVAREGTASPGSQTVRLATAAAGANLEIAARVGVSTFDGGDWLEVRPRNVAVAPGRATLLTVQPALASLRRGQYRGALTLLFNDGSPTQVVNVLFVVASPPSAIVPANGAADGDSPAATDCAPQRLFAVQRGLRTSFSAPLGWPQMIEVQVVDDCGFTVPNATVVASFTSGDPALPLVSLRNGIYVATWRPLNASPQLTVRVRASQPPLAAAEVETQGTSAANPTAPLIFPAGVVNAASFAPNSPVAPGSIVSVFGQNLAQSTALADALPLPTTLGQISLQIGGINVPLFYSATGQVNAQIPFELAANTRPQVVVRGAASLTVPETITLSAVGPACFTTNQQGTGQGAILDARGRLVDSAAPAAAGEIVQVFCTGLGATNPPVPSGQAAPGDPLARVVVPVEATVGGQPAVVHFAGLAPGFVGLYQINVQIPEGVTAGSAAQLVLTQSGVPSNTVTLAVR